VIATHLYGRLADMEALASALAGRGVALIEDCAQAHGARREGRRAGSFGDIGCFSFYPTKNLGALGDGGALTTRDAAIAGRLRQLRQYGWDRKYHVALAGGRNSRLDEIQAAVLRVRLPLVDGENARRRSIVAAYAAEIRHPGICVPAPAGEDCVAHLAVVRCTRRDSLQRHLEVHGVGSDVHYPFADHLQPIMGSRERPPLPVTERACAEVLTLPCFPAMSDAEAAHVIAACNAWPS
jgi:dTDP-4-amino-4,6-dideoxygalactose transaminase